MRGEKDASYVPPPAVFPKDDMIPPESCSWVKYIVKLFRRHERLGAIGTRGGIGRLGAL